MKTEFKNLKNAIHIQNEYNRIASPILEHVKQVSKQFIGKKITTQKGLSAKYAEQLGIDRQYKESFTVKPIEGAKWANVHFVHVKDSYNSLSVEISLCFSDGKTGCSYEGRSWYFGKTDDSGILLNVDDTCKVGSTVLDYETELKKIQKFRELEKKAELAEDEILINREAYKYIRFEDF